LDWREAFCQAFQHAVDSPRGHRASALFRRGEREHAGAHRAGALMVLSLVMDYLASMYGAKRLGATWRGVLARSQEE